MSPSIERIINHQAMEVVSKLAEVLEGIPVETLSTAALAEVERLRDCARYLGSSIRSSDPHLVPFSALSTIESSANGCIAEINNFIVNGNENNLTNASTSIDSALIYAAQLPVRSPTEAAEGMRDSLVSFRRSAGQYLSALEKQQDELTAAAIIIKTTVDQALLEITTQKGRIDSVVTEYQQQFSHGEASRRDEFTRTIQENTTRLSELIDKHRDRLDGTIEESRKELSSALDRIKTQTTDIREAAIDDSKDILADLQAMRIKTQELMHVIGNTGMAGEFQKAATSARNRAFFWQSSTVVSIISLIAFAIWAFYATLQGDMNPTAVGTRVFVAIAFGVLAAFSARQADRCLNSEQHNRRYQLELSSIDPYLISLPEERRHEVKIKLAEKLFGSEPALEQGKSNTPKLTGTSMDALKIALETIQELIKKAP